MQRVAERGLEVAAIAIRVVVDHRPDAVGPVKRPVHILLDPEQAADRQRAADVVCLTVVQAAMQRLLVAVAGAILEHVRLDVLAPAHALHEGRLVKRPGVVDLVVRVHDRDEVARGLIPRAGQPAARRVRGVIPRA